MSKEYINVGNGLIKLKSIDAVYVITREHKGTSGLFKIKTWVNKSIKYYIIVNGHLLGLDDKETYDLVLEAIDKLSKNI